MVCCQAYRPPEEIFYQFSNIEGDSKKACLALPYATLEKHREQIAALPVWRGLTDIPSVTSGTFSESVAVRLAKEAQVDFVILGDATSRQSLYESDQSIALKVRALLKEDITPFVCFGESLQDHERGNTEQVIQDQLSTILLGLTFDEITRVVLIYKCPWINHTAPENFAVEHKNAHHGIQKAVQHLFGKDAASHISIFTDLPLTSDDFGQIEYDIPPSGYFLELEGRDPQLIADYYSIISHTAPKARKVPRLTPPKAQHAIPIPDPDAAPPPPKEKKKKKSKKEATAIEEMEVAEESILSVDDELDDATLHYEIDERDDATRHDASGSDEFDFEWYSDEELEALRNEFGIEASTAGVGQPLPVWDANRPVRIIKTTAQKAEKGHKRTRESKPKKPGTSRK